MARFGPPAGTRSFLYENKTGATTAIMALAPVPAYSKAAVPRPGSWKAITQTLEKMQDKHKLAELELYLNDEEGTKALAAQLAPMLCSTHPAFVGQAPGGRIHLKGELGAGKTSFARALLRACGITGRIKSPSYALLETYNLSNLYFYHLDFYRLSDPREWLDAGFRDILQKEAVILIEWPDQAGTELPLPDLELNLEYAGAGRHAHLTAYSNKGKSWLTSLVPPQQKFPPGESRGDA